MWQKNNNGGCESVSDKPPAFLVCTSGKVAGMQVLLGQAEKFLPSPPMLAVMDACQKSQLQACDAVLVGNMGLQLTRVSPHHYL